MTASPFAEVRLGDVLAAVPVTGVRQDSEGDEGGVPFVTTTLVSAGVGALTVVPDERTRLPAKGRTASFGDILLVCRGIERRPTVPGAILRVDAELAFSESLVLIRVDAERADPDYVRLYLTSELGATGLVAATTGTTISYLRPEGLMSVRLRLPPLEDQHLVAAKLGAMQDQLAKLEETVGALQGLVSTAREGMIAGILRPRPAGSRRRVSRTRGEVRPADPRSTSR
jgi:hypothetical protein